MTEKDIQVVLSKKSHKRKWKWRQAKSWHCTCRDKRAWLEWDLCTQSATKLNSSIANGLKEKTKAEEENQAWNIECGFTRWIAEAAAADAAIHSGTDENEGETKHNLSIPDGVNFESECDFCYCLSLLWWILSHCAPIASNKRFKRPAAASAAFLWWIHNLKFKSQPGARGVMRHF